MRALARATGLWNYIDKSDADARDRFVAEAATVEGLNEITLHREQMAALNVLISGKNLILSAPTSFGKSILIDTLLLSGQYQRVAIVLPTIALLDEFRRRLLTRFGDSFDIIMHHSETSSRERVIFLGTQERILLRDDLKNLDLVGRIPRALASRFVRMFNQGDLPILLCTSTLIEGVNTAAKSIIIYDRTISRSPYDYFTFSNIRGRAGRLGQHRVGNVYQR